MKKNRSQKSRSTVPLCRTQWFHVPLVRLYHYIQPQIILVKPPSSNGRRVPWTNSGKENISILFVFVQSMILKIAIFYVWLRVYSFFLIYSVYCIFIFSRRCTLWGVKLCFDRQIFCPIFFPQSKLFTNWIFHHKRPKKHKTHCVGEGYS